MIEKHCLKNVIFIQIILSFVLSRKNIKILYIYLIHIANMRMTMSSSGTAVLLEFDTLHSLENDKRSTHYNDRHRLCTFKCNLYKVTALLMPEYHIIKCSSNKKLLSAKQQRDLKAKKRKYNSEKKTDC